MSSNNFYLKLLIYKNIGPLTNVRIDLSFYDNGNPKPVVLVGENGTGKSTVLSNIVDAFYEMATKAFSNASITDSGINHTFYKTLSPQEMHIDSSYMYSFITFDFSKEINYLFKFGDLTEDEFKNQTGIKTTSFSWKAKDNSKYISADLSDVEEIWNKNILCYFGPDRYEKPSWMGSKYFNLDDHLHLKLKDQWKGHLDNPIIVQNSISSNIQWLLDIIVDSRADIFVTEDKHIEIAPSINKEELLALNNAKEYLEILLSNILGKEVYFKLSYRYRKSLRLSIIDKKDNSVICPTLDSLSTGQIVLFNLFATIIRYADNNDINKSINPADISGIVIIDEIELHLHSSLQKEVLPNLIKLFPKIQFVLTSHSPAFLLGMKDVFGDDGFDILEMPNAERISIERFSEFRKAYEYLRKTESYQADLKKAIEDIHPTSPVVITEGSTDWKHLKAAYESLKNDGKRNDLFNNLHFDFLEYEPVDGVETDTCKINMGNSVLSNICENMAKIPQPVKYIFIADRDDKDTNKKLSNGNCLYKKWGNNVYSFVLPIPPHRKSTPDISIEHYYSDNEIKTELVDQETGITRRLYIGNEFDLRGISNELNMFCEKKNKCGPDKIYIIDGTDGEKVTSINNNKGINYAMPKSLFAKMILENKKPFDSFNRDAFIPVFEILRDIINEA